LEKGTAYHIVSLMINVLNSYVKPMFHQDGSPRVLIIGMEAAGGV
jgi:hypothetical protein